MVPLKRIFAAAGLLALLLTLSPTARATTLVPLDLDQLTDLASAVFTGTAVHSEVVSAEEGSFPFTFVTFQVESVLKGDVERQLTLRFQGGVTEKRTVVVHGMPQFETGETYLLFLDGDGTAASPVLGWVQGQYRFAREARSGKEILVDWRGAPLLGVDAHGRWQRGEPQDLDPDAPARPAPVLLAAEGVEVTAVDVPVERRPEDIPAAAQVLQSLGSLLRARAGRPTFTPGRSIASADPQDAPARIGGSVTPPLP